MSKKFRTNLLKYGIAASVGALMVYATLDLHGFQTLGSTLERYRLLCDAFTIPGVILILSGVLVWVSNQGAFDGISYALKRAVSMLIPASRKEHIRYSDYLEEKRAKGGVNGYSFLFYTGLVFLAAALVFYALFYSKY